MKQQAINVGDWVKHPSWRPDSGPVLAVAPGVVAVLRCLQWSSDGPISWYVHLETDTAALVRMEPANAETAATMASMLEAYAAQFQAQRYHVQAEGGAQ